MNFKPEITELKLNETLFTKRVTENVQGDIIVPDTKGDIGKILQTDGVAVIDSKEINGGRITVSGTVYVNILYAPQDGGIDSMNTSMNFTHVAKTEYDDVRLFTDCRIKSVDHSMYNTRKINVKATVNLKLEGKREICPQILSGCESDGIVECRKAQITSVPVYISTSDVIPFRETFDIPSGCPSAESILKCSANFTDRDFRLLSNKAVIRGNVSVSVLYKGEDGSVTKCEFTHPFTEITDAHGAQEDMKENIRATLSPFTAEITSNGDGDRRSFFVEGKIYVETNAYENEPVEVITDMFCTEIPLELTTRAVPDGVSFSTTMISQIKDIINSGSIKEITDIVSRPVIENVSVNAGTLSVSGTADTELLCRDGNDNFFTVKKSVPFICNGSFEGANPIATAEIINPVAECAGGNAEIRMTVAVNAEGSASDGILCVTDATVSEKTSSDNIPSLTVYYARSGDTLWNIAKNFMAPVKNIREANNLGDVIKEGQKIIIPR